MTPVEVWGPAAETKELGKLLAYAEHLLAAHAWDTASLKEHQGRTGAHIKATEVSYDKPAKVYGAQWRNHLIFPGDHTLFRAPSVIVLITKAVPLCFPAIRSHVRPLLEACKGGVDLLIHESFPTASVFAKKASVPQEQAELIVNQTHTSPAMVGKVFKSARARMSVMWHLVVDHATVGPAYQEMRNQYDGPVTVAQDLTVFNITKNAVVARQAIIDPSPGPLFRVP